MIVHPPNDSHAISRHQWKLWRIMSGTSSSSSEDHTRSSWTIGHAASFAWFILLPFYDILLYTLMYYYFYYYIPFQMCNPFEISITFPDDIRNVVWTITMTSCVCINIQLNVFYAYYCDWNFIDKMATNDNLYKGTQVQY